VKTTADYYRDEARGILLIARVAEILHPQLPKSLSMGRWTQCGWPTESCHGLYIESRRDPFIRLVVFPHEVQIQPVGYLDNALSATQKKFRPAVEAALEQAKSEQDAKGLAY
jgi:hypothetical protein